MPGRRPTPTYLKLLKGNPGKRRLNKNEPVPRIPASAPEPPAFLSDIAKEEWARVSGELYAMHLLTTVDVAALALYCDAYSRWRTATEAIAAMALRDDRTHGLLIKTRAGEAAANPLIWIASSAAKTMLRAADEFGMTEREAGEADSEHRPGRRLRDRRELEVARAGREHDAAEFLRRHERHEETGVLRIVDVAEIRIEVRSEHLADERARPVRARIERHDVGRRRIVVVGRAPNDGQSVARPVERHLAAFDVPPPVGRVASAIRIPAGITEFRWIRRHDVDLANLDLRRAGSDAVLCIVRAGRVHAAVIVDRDAVYDCCRRRRSRSRQDHRPRSGDTQKNLTHFKLTSNLRLIA
jgi:P27 family predicted phage terminase small subunit